MTTKDNVRAVAEELKTVLAEFGKKHNMTFELGRTTYNSNNMSTSVVGIFAGGVSKELDTLRVYAPLYGMKPTICNAQITLQGHKYTVTGMKRKRATIERVSDKKGFVINIEELSKHVAAHHPEHTAVQS